MTTPPASLPFKPVDDAVDGHLPRPDHVAPDSRATAPGLLESVLESLIVGVLVLDTTGRVIMANRAAYEAIGGRYGSYPGRELDPEIMGRFRMEPSDLESAGLDATGDWWRSGDPRVPTFREVTRLRFRYDLPTGETRRGWITTRKGCDDDGNPVLVVSISDITDQEHERDQLRHLARTDVLTGLANRAVLEEHLSRLVTVATRTRAASGSVLFIDLDGFKQVNDRFGHGAGDRVLEVVARRLRSSLRSADVAGRVESQFARGQSPLAARYGGDEFVVLTSATTPAAMGALTRRISDAIADPIVVDGHSIRMAASIGSAPIEPDASIREILAMADRFVYEAKAANRSHTA